MRQLGCRLRETENKPAGRRGLSTMETGIGERFVHITGLTRTPHQAEPSRASQPVRLQLETEISQGKNTCNISRKSSVLRRRQRITDLSRQNPIFRAALA
jgi:hypothetical protein